MKTLLCVACFFNAYSPISSFSAGGPKCVTNMPCSVKNIGNRNNCEENNSENETNNKQ